MRCRAGVAEREEALGVRGSGAVSRQSLEETGLCCEAEPPRGAATILKCDNYQHVGYLKLGLGAASWNARASSHFLAQPALVVESRRAHHGSTTSAGLNLRRHAAAAQLNAAATFRPAAVGIGADARAGRARARSRAHSCAPLRHRTFGSSNTATKGPRASQGPPETRDWPPRAFQ